MSNGEGNENDQSLWSNLRELIISPHVLFSILGLAVVGALGFGIYSAGGKFLNSLQNTEVARGLITFLVAVATVAIAIILALYAVVSNGSDLKERFALGKEVLTTLIGVLGTIVGFYFGSSTDTRPSANSIAPLSRSQPLQIAPFSISDQNPKKGQAISVASFIYGGKPPYRYTLSLSPSDLVPPISGNSPDGSIKEEIKLPDTAQKDQSISLIIEAEDSAGSRALLEDKTRALMVTE